MLLERSSFLLVICVGWLSLIVNANNYGSVKNTVSFKPVENWRFEDYKNEKTLDIKNEDFPVGRFDCSSNCIRSTSGDEMPQVLHLTWNLQKPDNRPTFHEEKVSNNFKREISHFSNVKKKECLFSIVTKCKIPEGLKTLSEKEERFIKSLQPNYDSLNLDGRFTNHKIKDQKILETNYLMGKNETKFVVSDGQAELNAIIIGDVSGIHLKMPVGIIYINDEAKSTSPQIMLTSSTRTRESATQGALKLNVLNPPQGSWTVGLDGIQGRAYRIIVTTSVWPESDDADDKLDVVDGVSTASVSVSDAFQPGERKAIAARQVSDPDFENDEDSREMSASYAETTRILPNISSRIGEDVAESRNGRLDYGDYSLKRHLGGFDDWPLFQPLLVELDPDTELRVEPNRDNLIHFEVTNNDWRPISVRCIFSVEPRPMFPLQPPIDQLILPNRYIRPVYNLRFDIPAPNFRVTLEVLPLPPLPNLPVSEPPIRKTVTAVVRNPNMQEVYHRDEWRPIIRYSFNDNCDGRTSPQYCAKSFWSVDITVQDAESGLKTAVSRPRGMYTRMPYETNTVTPVDFYYASNCCVRDFQIIAVDVAGNKHIRTIDVTVWWNLNWSQIFLIILCVLMILILIGVICYAYCMHRANNRELPFTQRYGSSRREERE